jgi:inhibitor of Bruton tyrosine kinase
MTILLLCHYFYTDKVVAIWDRRVTLAIMDRYGGLQINTSTVKYELRRLAPPTSLKLPFLEVAA